MKKIAIITTSYTGSTLPLAKAFVGKGYSVDYYIINNQIREAEALNCSYTAPKYGINEIPEDCFKELRVYIGCGNFHLMAISLPRPYKTVPVLNSIMKILRSFFIIKTCRLINRREYALVNISTRFDANDFLTYLNYLESKVLVSLHEVSDYKFYKESVKPTPLLRFLFKNKTQIVLHSKHTYNALGRYQNVDYSNVSVIPFGLFDSFLTIPTVPLQLPDNYILFYGGIFPYKGLNVLYEAINLMGNQLRDYKVVVAGKGDDPVLEKVIKDERFCVINKRLSNSELVTVISNSTVVVCPYLTVSQSGIPQTSFVFKKPIIASDLPAFREVITENQEGLFFDASDSNQLSQRLAVILNNQQLRESMVNNIERFEELHPVYSWSAIADKYLEFSNI